MFKTKGDPIGAEMVANDELTAEQLCEAERLRCGSKPRGTLRAALLSLGFADEETIDRYAFIVDIRRGKATAERAANFRAVRRAPMFAALDTLVAEFGKPSK